MIGCERVAVGLIHRQHANHAVQSFQRHDQRRLQRRMFSRIDDVSRFHLRIAVHDRLAVCRHPSAQSLAHSDLQRRQHAEVFSAHQFRQQPAIAIYEHGDRIVGNHAPQPHRQHRKRFAQAQRHAQILAQLKHGLRFLPGRGNRGQKVRVVHRPCA